MLEQLLVHELRQRAIVAAAEDNATARSDARYFDVSAAIIETLLFKLAVARRILSAADKGSPIYIAVQRVLDENSAWIAAPNPEVVKQIALAAGIAWMAAEPVPESLADMASSLAEARTECDRLRGLLWYAWHEFNAIRARSGAPLTGDGMPTCSEDSWDQMTEAFAEAIGPDARRPWPSAAALAALNEPTDA